MKPLLQSRTPMQLLWIIAAFNALVMIFFGIPWHRGGQHLLLWCSLAAAILGIIGALITEQSLENGISAERWSDSLLNTTRKLTRYPVWFVLIGSLLICALAFMVTLSLHESGRAWMYIWPAMTLTLIRLQSALHPKTISNGLLQPIERAKPLQSESWGTPPRPFSS
ncbi:MAG: hypothetical protein ACRD3K_08465 [Edaphobacter sp.]